MEICTTRRLRASARRPCSTGLSPHSAHHHHRGHGCTGRWQHEHNGICAAGSAAVGMRGPGHTGVPGAPSSVGGALEGSGASGTTPTFRERRGWSHVPSGASNGTGGSSLEPGAHTGVAPKAMSSGLGHTGLGAQGQHDHVSMLESSPPRRGSLSVSPAHISGAGPAAQRNAVPSLLSSPIASEVIYCVVSAGTTLFNKAMLSNYDFPAPNLLLLFQFVLAVGLLQALQLLRVIKLQPLRLETVKVWVPVNLIFVAMNATGFYALQDIGAGMFTVLKNLSNLMTIAGDYVIFGYTYNWQVWGCLFLMILSALLGGWTDAQFSIRGYTWQLINCLFTAAYSLYLSAVIRKLMRQHGKAHLSELSMVYYNNLLSVPAIMLLSLASGEPWHLPAAKQIANHEFQAVAVMGGLLGFGVSFASIWCMSRTSATIYSLTGSMNKVVVALCGMWYFKEETSMANLASIGAGLAAGFLFVYAKSGGSAGGAAASAGPKDDPPEEPGDEEAPLLPASCGGSHLNGLEVGGKLGDPPGNLGLSAGHPLNFKVHGDTRKG